MAVLSDADLVASLAMADVNDTEHRPALIDAIRARLACIPIDRVMTMLATTIDVGEGADGGDLPGVWDGEESGGEHCYWLCLTELKGRPVEAVMLACAAWAVAADPNQRAAAADIVGALAEAAGDDKSELALVSRPIVTRLLEDDDAGVIAAAIGAFGHLCEQPRTASEIARLLSFETHPDEDVRWSLLHCLRTAHSSSEMAALIRLSRDPVGRIRDWATFALGSLSEADTPEVREALIARLEDPDVDTRGEAMRGLAERGDRRAVPAIARELAQDEVGDLVIEAAGLMPDASYLPVLEDLLAHMPDDADVIAAIAACRSGQPSPRWSA